MNVKEMTWKRSINYWIILHRKKHVIILTALISALSAIVMSLLITPVYESKATFYVPEASSSLSYLSDDSLFDLQKEILSPVPKESSATPFFGILQSRKIAEYVNKEFPEKSIKKLLFSDIDFEISDGFMIALYSRDKDPVLASKIADSYVKNLNLLLQETSIDNLERDNSALKEKLEETISLIRKAEDKIKTIKEENDIASIEDEMTWLTDQRISFIGEMENKQVYLGEVKKKLKELSLELEKEGSTLASQHVALSNPKIEHLQVKLSDIAAEVSGMLVRYTKDHPEILNLKAQYNELSKELKNEADKLIASQIKPENTFYEKLRQDLVNLIIEESTVSSSIKGYKEAIQRADERLEKLPAILTETGRMTDSIERHKKIYEQLELAYQESLMQMGRDVQFLVTLDKANVPENPSFPIVWLNGIIALFGGLFTGIAYAFFLNYAESVNKASVRRIVKSILGD